MKQRILSGWNFVRVLWLVMGIGISIQAITERNYLMLFPALYFVFAAIANIGCCASGGCATNFNNNHNSKKESITEIEYKEIQSKD